MKTLIYHHYLYYKTLSTSFFIFIFISNEFRQRKESNRAMKYRACGDNTLSER